MLGIVTTHLAESSLHPWANWINGRCRRNALLRYYCLLPLSNAHDLLDTHIDDVGKACMFALHLSTGFCKDVDLGLGGFV